MNKIQLTILIVIIAIFAVIFYSSQAGNLGLNTPPKGQVNISQIPQQMDFITQTPPPNQQQQAQAQQQQQTAQSSPVTQASLESYKTASATAVIKTSKGDITLALYGEDAPYTVANFIKKSKDGFYDNLSFHRVEYWVIQGGDPKGDGTGGGSIPVEFNEKPFLRGSLGAASRGDGKVQNDSQFFITKEDSSHLNGAYTNFGIVTEGLDIVDQITIGDKILGVTIR